MLGLRILGGLPGAVVAERWLYLPSVGGCLFLGGVFAQGWFRAPRSSKRLLAMSGTVLLLLLAWKQAAWNAVWRNEESIARAIVSTAPHSALGYYNLGNFLRRFALPRDISHWSLRSVQLKLIKIGAKVVNHARRTVFQCAEVAVSAALFADLLERVRCLAAVTT